WELNARASSNRLTPTLDEVWTSLGDLVSSGDLWFHGRLTLFRGFIGLAIALIAGLGAGFAMARSRLLDAALQPLLAGAYPIPKLALYPVMILVHGFGGASKVWQVALECFFPIAYNAYAGAKGLDRNLLWLARNNEASQLRTTRDVILPAALPSVLTGLRIAAPIMLIVITVTEMLGESRGLGFLIRDAQANFQAPTALAVVLVLGVIGFVFDRLIVLVTRKAVFWEQGVQL
ncbi:MAG: ABC transporter permease, partial [Dehalococcoidia bacterium]